MTSLVSPSFLKQVARRIKKEKLISQSRALDEAAKLHGFSNYKNYLNALEENKKDPPSSKENLLRDIFSEVDIQKKESLAISYIHNSNPPFHILYKIINEFKNTPERVQSVCRQSDLQNEAQKILLSYFMESKSDVQALPLMEGFIAKHISIRALDYTLKNGLICIKGKYHLEFQFEEDIHESQKHLPHFRRDPMFGEFEVSFDEKMNTVVENPTISDEIDGKVYKSLFKLNHKK